MSDDEMSGKDFQRILKALKAKGVNGDCPACGAGFAQRGTLSNYSSLGSRPVAKKIPMILRQLFYHHLQEMRTSGLFHADTLIGLNACAHCPGTG